MGRWIADIFEHSNGAESKLVQGRLRDQVAAADFDGSLGTAADHHPHSSR